MKKVLLFCSAFLGLSVVARAKSDTLTIVRTMDEVVVNAPVAQVTNNKDVLSHEVLNRTNTGQNLPYLLSIVPNLQVTSDDGLGIGYTYFRIRGTDHTRINMTVNDVPLNDSESQTVFWVNMTDMSSSLSSLEVQRGVGTSTNGSASFGASINMQTHGIEDSLSHYTLGFNGGMYNTFRELLQAKIALPNHWIANARFSKVNSDGFLYRTSSDLYSYYTDLGWYGKQTQVVARCFGGSEKTGMGWDGVDYNTAYGIDGADRRYNPAGEYTLVGSNGEDSLAYYDNQTDNYSQLHAQLSLYHRFSSQWSLTATAHYTHGYGYYEQYKKKSFSYWGLPSYTDAGGNEIKKAYGLYRKHLNNHFYGGIVSAKYISEAIDIQIGGAANHYMGAHYGTLHHLQDSLYGGSIPVQYEYYRNNADKVDANIYSKLNWRILQKGKHRLSLYADMQYRFVRYMRNGLNDEDMQDLPLQVNYHFFNPKAGLSYQFRQHLWYGSFAIANREPSRNNYKENVVYDALTQTYTGLPQAERLYDYELGYLFNHRIFSIGANLYYMDYDNQLVLTGKVNDVGAQSTINVKDSYRMGIELSAQVQIAKWLTWQGNVTLSRNKIQNYKETITRYDDDYNWLGEEEQLFKETTIAFSPSITAMSLFQFAYRGIGADLYTSVVGKQYLDNTQNETAALKTYTTTNLQLTYQLPLEQWLKRPKAPQIRLLCQVNNLFNAKYASNGGSDCSYFENGTACWPWYYAQAGINVHAGVRIEM